MSDVEDLRWMLKRLENHRRILRIEKRVQEAIVKLKEIKIE